MNERDQREDTGVVWDDKVGPVCQAAPWALLDPELGSVSHGGAERWWEAGNRPCTPTATCAGPGESLAFCGLSCTVTSGLVVPPALPARWPLELCDLGISREAVHHGDEAVKPKDFFLFENFWKETLY